MVPDRKRYKSNYMNTKKDKKKTLSSKLLPQTRPHQLPQVTWPRQD